MNANTKLLPHKSKIQKYAYLIITDLGLKIIGISENAKSFKGLVDVTYLGESLEEYIHQHFRKGNKKLLKGLKNIQNRKLTKKIITKKIEGEVYYFIIYILNEKIYFEWEKQITPHLHSEKINLLESIFENNPTHSWQLVCKTLNKLIHFDRVLILQIYENKFSKFIAEYSKNKQDSLIHEDYAPIFLSEEILKFYNIAKYRYIPNLHEERQDLETLHDPNEYTITRLTNFPKLNEEYLTSKGFKAYFSSSLYLNGKLWGVVVALDKKENYLDLQKRKLFTYVVQNAMDRFESKNKQILLDKNRKHNHIESQIIKNLYQNSSTYNTLIQHADDLIQLTKSDGIGIFYQGDIYLSGLHPSENEFEKLIEFLQKEVSKNIFKDYNFKLHHAKNFDFELNFGGILTLKLSSENDFYLIWFRKEVDLFVINLDDKTNFTKEKIIGASTPWDQSDILIAENLNKMITESLLIKALEKQKSNEELMALNNELEMFSYSLSHDLKNPLAALNMGIQLLTNPPIPLSPEQIKQGVINLKDSVNSIEEVINNIVKVSQSKSKEIKLEAFPMNYTLKKIYKELLMSQNNPNIEVKFGKLYPVWGEKSFIYQIFLNIIGNSMKYTCHVSGGTIEIDSQLDDKFVIYSIKDNGIGIPKNNLPHIFDMFNRADNAKEYNGSGIGLSLVRRILERINGQIIIESEEGKGTHVKLFFPIINQFPKTYLET